jgi:hypothetical protein
MLIVAYGNIFRERVAEAHPQVEVLMCCRQGFELPPHDDFAAVAYAVEQPDFAPGLFAEAPVEHAQHRRDADAAADQHHRIIAAVNMEMAARRAHLQDAADSDLIVKVARGTARRHIATGGAGTRLIETR